MHITSLEHTTFNEIVQYHDKLQVLEEAIESNTNMLISYHPPIFKAFKRLGQKEWKEQIVVKCLENKIALYSPHTAWDCVRGGVNDWLVQPFGALATLFSTTLIHSTKHLFH